MVEHPGMWDEARSLFQVGTVAGVQQKWPKPVGCGVSTRFGGGLDKRFDYRKEANNQTRAKDRPNAARSFDFYRAGTKAGTEEVCQISTLLTRFSSVSRISSR